MKPSKKIFMIAGYNTISMGTGRREFNPKKERPGLEHYLKEAGLGALQQIGGAGNVDEGVVGNFMASRFNKQAHLGAFLGMIDPQLRLKPSTRVEGACASGGLALVTGIKSALSGSAEVVLALGVEVQNTVKAIYGADILAGAGWFQRRKEGHAYFFPDSSATGPGPILRNMAGRNPVRLLPAGTAMPLKMPASALPPRNMKTKPQTWKRWL
ncbi:hypothetical protein [Lentimicrobium saccharophilum]|uniref:hypothetical protein n=1 Tax=Lentimicrobium saccharophilum TaxID=1678841 RepID=UPI001F205D28|nr:hypothetical protein [Lentimicrobium saccharophilum]